MNNALLVDLGGTNMRYAIVKDVDGLIINQSLAVTKLLFQFWYVGNYIYPHLLMSKEQTMRRQTTLR